MRGKRTARLVMRMSPAPDNSDLDLPCPRCEVPRGWRCVRYVGSQRKTLKNVHKERKVRL